MWMRKSVGAFGLIVLLMKSGCGVPDEGRKNWDQQRQLHELLMQASSSSPLADRPELPPRLPILMNLEEQWAPEATVLVAISSENEPWIWVVRDVADQAGLSILLPDVQLDAAGKGSSIWATPVSLTLNDVPARQALETLGRLIDRQPVSNGGVISFEALGVGSMTVIEPGFVSVDEAVQLLSGIDSGKKGVVKPVGQRVIVAGDAALVRRATAVGDMLGSAQLSQWMISVWICELSAEARDTFGVQLRATATLQGLVGGSAAEIISRAVLDGTAIADQRRAFSKLLTRGTLVLIEGETSRLQSGETLPYPKRTVSPYGTITTSEYGFIDTGLILSVTGRRVPDGLRLQLKPEVSVVTGFVESVPRVAKRTLDVGCIVRSGDWVVLAGLDDWRQSVDRPGLGGLLVDHNTAVGSVVVILRAVELGTFRDFGLTSTDESPILEPSPTEGVP